MSDGAPVSVMMAAPRLDTILQGMYPALAGDPGRFAVVGLATEWEDFKRKIEALRPEALLMQGEIAPGPDELASALKRFPGVAVVVLMPSSAAAEGVVRSAPCVRDVFVTQVPSWPEVAQRLYQAAVSERALRAQATPPAFAQPHPGRPPIPVGLRLFAVFSRKGGVGKSTIAVSFAYALARRGISTLLIGFDRPDDIGVFLNLPPYPNQSLFFENPSPESLRAAVQKRDALDVLLCVPDDVAAEAIARRDPADRGLHPQPGDDGRHGRLGGRRHGPSSRPVLRMGSSAAAGGQHGVAGGAAHPGGCQQDPAGLQAFDREACGGACHPKGKHLHRAQHGHQG
jgi:ATPases involved in chromosome partitioning